MNLTTNTEAGAVADVAAIARGLKKVEDEALRKALLSSVKIVRILTPAQHLEQGRRRGLQK